ncbi:MAG: hypothetical protein GXP33_09195 [Spirochaetes bacterium]|nr:hypothetical protein [Spirochaetota bacterium]
MKKKLFPVVLLLLFVLYFPLSAQDLKPLGNDLSSLLDGLGREMLPDLAQSSLLGTGMGEAETGDFPHMFFAFSGGAVLSHGIGRFIDPENTAFKLLNVSGLIDQALAGAGADVQNLYKTSKGFFPYPNYRFAVGFGTVYGVETILTISMFPQGLTDFAAGLAGLKGVTLNSFNGGIRVRKVLLSDAGGFPGVSLGAGYSYTNFNAGYSLTGFSQDLSGFTLDLKGDLSMEAAVHSAGVDLNISKKLLVFIPFFRVSAWYQWADFTGSVNNFDASIVNGSTTVSYTGQGGTDPAASYSLHNLSLLLTGGLEIKLGGFALTASAVFDPSDFTLGVETGIRGQF